MPQQSSSNTWCKICGITSLADAGAAQQAGADALGFNCYEKSPRYIPAAELKTLTAAVKATRVALFVNASHAQVAHVMQTAEIDMLQFQGDEEEAFCAGFGLPYMKAVRMQAHTDVITQAQAFNTAWALLLDAYVPGQPGGTGQQFDWKHWPDLTATDHAGTKLVLAGGLTPLNVAAAVKHLKPFGVDVCGGVEGPEKGRKDHQKVAKFLQEVRSVGC